MATFLAYVDAVPGRLYPLVGPCSSCPVAATVWSCAAGSPMLS